MSSGYDMVNKATDRFYEENTGNEPHASGCRKHLRKHLEAALCRHGFSIEAAVRAEVSPHSICVTILEMGVTAIEIVAACALAEQDYLRSKA